MENDNLCPERMFDISGKIAWQGFGWAHHCEFGLLVYLMKSKTCIFFHSRLPCNKALRAKGVVQLHTLCATFGVVLKMSSFLSLRCFSENEEAVGDGELFVNLRI